MSANEVMSNQMRLNEMKLKWNQEDLLAVTQQIQIQNFTIVTISLKLDASIEIKRRSLHLESSDCVHNVRVLVFRFDFLLSFLLSLFLFWFGFMATVNLEWDAFSCGYFDRIVCTKNACVIRSDRTKIKHLICYHKWLKAKNLRLLKRL